MALKSRKKRDFNLIFKKIYKMELKEVLKILKEKNFRTSLEENPDLVERINELENMGYVRMMKSADDGSISVAITTQGFNAMTELGIEEEGRI